VLTQSPSNLGAREVREMLLATLREATGEALAYYPSDPPARVCAGDVTTGLVHALSPFNDEIVIATIRGDAMSDALRETILAQGVHVAGGASGKSGAQHRVATLAYAASREDEFGKAERVDPSSTDLRGALIAFLRDRDLGAFRG